MADPKTCPPLIPKSISAAHSKIASYIHETPLLTCKILDQIASSSNPQSYLSDDTDDDPSSMPNGGSNGNGSAHTPRIRLHFKCENFQKIGAFKARGAFHAVLRLIEELGIGEVKERGVVTHSSGNHAQALALAASTFKIPAYIVMPRISTPSKIAGTRMYTQHVIFSGSTSTEREEVVRQVIEDTGAILVPPYDHPDIILGQGTTGKEMEIQFQKYQNIQHDDEDDESSVSSTTKPKKSSFDAVIAPIGGGGLLGGIATWFSGDDNKKDKVKVYGAEPSFEEADDARRGLDQGERILHVKSLTIADGLRTPVGLTNWDIISNKSKLQGIYSVTEEEIKWTMQLVFERMKLVVEPSGVVGLAVVLFNTEFREHVSLEQQRQQDMSKEEVIWDIGIVFSGGNTTMKAITSLFSDDTTHVQEEERSEGKVGINGEKKVEDVPG